MSDDQSPPEPIYPSADDDLSPILKKLMERGHLLRKSPKTMVKLANSPGTRECLKAGFDLIAAQFSPPAEQPDSSVLEKRKGTKEIEGDTNPFFAWLTQDALVKEMNSQREKRHVRPITAGVPKHRWTHHSDFIEDLLAYVLWSQQWRQHIEVAAEVAEPLANDPDFAHAIQQAAYQDLCLVMQSRAYRVGLIAAATADRYPTTKETRGEAYEATTKAFMAAYQASLDKRGLKLRPDITLEQVTTLLTALVEGMALREISDPNAESFIDHERQWSLFGLGALAIASACIDSGDKRTIEERLQMITDKSTE